MDLLFIIYAFFFSITKLKNDLIVRLIIKKKRKKKITSVDFLNYLSDRIEHARLIIDCWIILWKSCRSSRIIVRAEGECHLEDH